MIVKINIPVLKNVVFVIKYVIMMSQINTQITNANKKIAIINVILVFIIIKIKNV